MKLNYQTAVKNSRNLPGESFNWNENYDCKVIAQEKMEEGSR